MSLKMRINRITGALILVSALAATPAFAQGSAVVTGRVADAATKAPIADVVVTATSPALQGEQIVVTDATGTYRIPNLPPGVYTIRYEKDAYRPFARSDVPLRTDRTTRVNVELLPEALKAEEVVIVAETPTIDVGSSSTGINVGGDIINNLAVIRPGGKNSATRSFESLAEIAPGAHSDQYGVSVNGTTSPENQYVIDGLSVNDPGYGILGTPLTVEFVKEVNVITGGYMPEYGRATGGIMNVVTKSGSNEFHGSVWGNITPGALEGQTRPIERAGGSISTEEQLWNQGDFGAEIGGPILKDKLWFYAGFAPAFNRSHLTRRINRNIPCTAEDFESGAFGCDNNERDGNGVQLTRFDQETGFQVTEEMEQYRRGFFADQQTFQYIGKLTYLINQDHNVTLSVYGAPTSSGGENEFGFDQQDGLPEVVNIVGTQEAIAHRYRADSNDIALKYSGAFLDKRALVDVTLGWHHQVSARLPSDGSEIGSNEGLAGYGQVIYRRTSPTPLNIYDFEAVDPAECTATVDVLTEDDEGNPITESRTIRRCPLTTYTAGGPGFLQEALLDRYQAKITGTYLVNALGHHVIKVGLDAEQMVYENNKAYSGNVAWRERVGGNGWDTLRMYGYLEAPDTPVIQSIQTARSTSNTIGVFAQDSWSVLDLFTLNAGFRYDQQTLIGADNEVGLVLGNQWSPRLGVIYDFTQEGRSKIYANYARFYESVPLDMVDRQFPGERQLFARYAYNPTTGEGCNPIDPASQEAECTDPDNLIPIAGGTPDPNFIITGGEKSTVDPDLIPQSSDEWVVGGEYEVFKDSRVGASYTKRYMNAVIEDMSRDEANTYFIGNPGYGIARDFPKAVRDYDAVSVYFNKSFSNLWLAQISYTWANLRGNYAGLFRPETGQLDPNINSDFDLISLLANRDGPLPGDRTHSFKAFGAKEFVITGAMSANIGLSYRTRSGTPINYLGSHPIYGADEVFILPRGSGGRLPWRHDIDMHLGYTYRITKDNAVTLSADVFNLFNFQAITAVDQRYTNDDVNPIPEGTEGTNDEKLSQLDVTVNPNFKNVTGYQAPRSIRFGAKVTF